MGDIEIGLFQIGHDRICIGGLYADHQKDKRKGKTHPGGSGRPKGKKRGLGSESQIDSRDPSPD